MQNSHVGSFSRQWPTRISGFKTFQINVVTEKRLYQSWADPSAPKQASGQATNKTGITAGKRALNALHIQLAAAGFNQVIFPNGESWPFAAGNQLAMGSGACFFWQQKRVGLRNLFGTADHKGILFSLLFSCTLIKWITTSCQ